ncbi:hypothetical protein Tco_1370077 [Tanacetum coccineum]
MLTSNNPSLHVRSFCDCNCAESMADAEHAPKCPHVSKAGSYKCQLDEQWFDLTKDTLRDAPHPFIRETSQQAPRPQVPQRQLLQLNTLLGQRMDHRIKPSRSTHSPEPAWTIPSSDLPVPTNNWASALKTTYVPPPDNSLLAQTDDITTFMDWYCKRQRISALTPKDLEGPAYEIVKAFHPDVVHLQLQMEECHKLLTDKVDDAILQYNVSKPLPLGGEPGHITIQSDFFFNKDLKYLRYGRKIGRPTLSISKMKAAFYPDVGLEQLVPDQFWIEEECKYDIAAMYGISHWWFQRQRFYIDRFSSEGDRRAVRTHMRILSVVRIKVFSMYGYDYMKKIILRRADLKEYVIAERDFKYMYPSDFEDLYLLNLQGHLNHLSPDDKKVLTTAVNLWTRNLVIRQRVEDFQLGIESYQTQLNLTKPRWDATGFEFKHDYTVIDSPRAVTFRDRYGVQMIMRFNEIHKFSDGTLQQIDEALDYRVKEFRVNRTNPGMNTRFWTKKDVVRSKEFMFAIQKRLKTRRIFRNLESFVGGRIREGDYRSYKDGKVRYSLPRSRQNRRDLPRDNPLVSVEVLSFMDCDTLQNPPLATLDPYKRFLFHFSLEDTIQFLCLSHSELVVMNKVAVRSAYAIKPKNALSILALEIIQSLVRTLIIIEHNIRVDRNLLSFVDGIPFRAISKQALGEVTYDLITYTGYPVKEILLKMISTLITGRSSRIRVMAGKWMIPGSSRVFHSPCSHLKCSNQRPP